MSYGSLPNTGLNASTPIYLLVGLVLTVGGFITTRLKKRHSA